MPTYSGARSPLLALLSLTTFLMTGCTALPMSDQIELQETIQDLVAAIPAYFSPS